VILLEYNCDDYVGSLLGKSVNPTILTPFYMVNYPGTVYSQFPPVSEARSTITLPNFIESTIALVISLGAGFPGMRAVVMTISTSLHYLANKAISASMNSFDITFA
jgi:hypothetical protein